MCRTALAAAKAKRLEAKKRQQLTFAQLASYDDILTDALVDHVYYWTTVPKNRPSYRPSRGMREEEIAKLIQNHLIVNPDLAVAEEKLLATEGLKKFYGALKTAQEQDNFKAHLRRYLSMYLPDCPFEVNATNRYTINTYEASITARHAIKRNETIKYLAGIHVMVTPEEEAQLALWKKDFSLVVSSRSKMTALLMGPARLANHDCDANARLVTRGQAGIDIVACRDIAVGDEITVTYSGSYFGDNNSDCLCQTCENNLVNGWVSADGQIPSVHRMVEDYLMGAAQGYSLRGRRRDESASCAESRSSSVTPDIRPRVLKTMRSQRVLGDRASTTDSTDFGRVDMSSMMGKRSGDAAGLDTPPVTPAKRLKTTTHYQTYPATLGTPISRGSSQTGTSRASMSSSQDDNGSLTEATSPEPEKAEIVTSMMSPNLSPIKPAAVVNPLEDQPLPEPSSATSESEPPTILPTTELASPLDTAADPNTAAAPTPLEVGLDASATEASPLSSEPTVLQPTSDTISQASLTQLNAKPAKIRRSPGDYTLTPLLLSEPAMAWIHCTNCSGAFVQKDAYFTKANCYRCERHSKLYGYVWPKTAPAGKGDREERVLDHRTINRFLGHEDEARARGRKLLRAEAGVGKELGAEGQQQRRGRGRPRVKTAGSVPREAKEAVLPSERGRVRSRVVEVE